MEFTQSTLSWPHSLLCSVERTDGNLSPMPESSIWTYPRTFTPTHYPHPYFQPTTPRLGMDHMTITPADEIGRTAVLILHEHWSKFTALFPLADYSAIEVARALLQYMTRYGPFAKIASDPGSAFLAEVVQELNSWLGIYHRVSSCPSYSYHSSRLSTRTLLVSSQSPRLHHVCFQRSTTF